MRSYFLTILISITIAFNAYSAEKIDCTSHRCIAVINAGSTGSRVYIYTYDLDTTNTPTHITQVWSNAIKPGLATLEPKSSAIFPYLNGLMNELPEYKGRVYFYATAGMRLNSEENAEAIYTLIRTWFKGKENLKLIEARTIEGKEEGLFDWLAVNYQLKRLNQTSKPLAAVIDIGGASTQIAFPLPKSQRDGLYDKQNLYSLTLYGHKVKVVSYSFLGLGENKALEPFQKFSPCYAQGYPLSAGIQGRGDMSQCTQSISKLINTYPLTDVKKLVSIYSPQEWYLIGGITYMLDTIHLKTNDKFTNLEMASKSEQQFCQTPWSTLKEDAKKQDNLQNSCAVSSYLYSLLVNGYGISNKEPINLMPNNQIDWSIGVVFLNP